MEEVEKKKKQMRGSEPIVTVLLAMLMREGRLDGVGKERGGGRKRLKGSLMSRERKEGKKAGMNT